MFEIFDEFLVVFCSIPFVVVVVGTSLTGILSDRIQTGYESIYVTFQHTFCMTDILTNFGSIQNTISMLCYVFIQASFDVLLSSIRIMLPVHLTKFLCCVEENYKIKSASLFIATDRRQW